MRYSTMLAASLALALGSLPALAAEPANNAHAALERIAANHFAAPYELAFRHGYWTAEATTAEGLRVDLLVNPATGEVTAFDQRGSGAIPRQQVRDIVLGAGYQHIDEIEFDDAFWEVEAIGAYGHDVDLVVHPVTGEILGQPQGPSGAAPLTAQQIRTQLQGAGYTGIHSLDFDDGYWEADATNPAGQRVEVKIDAYSGEIVRESPEDRDDWNDRDDHDDD